MKHKRYIIAILNIVITLCIITTFAIPLLSVSYVLILIVVIIATMIILSRSNKKVNKRNESMNTHIYQRNESQGQKVFDKTED